ncbi:hypothetical protein OH76DRAFT_1424009 [Lentinus brumalis]|uniref:Retrotransposon gag domain-containing protein n=1 Tax=Lentinus brumalis TaxID=2498619 RepID=A0A371CI34_9APHY|nr:hypothetical protein OH76DRAFT_1424009 [Polyporus brumalis]
MTTNAQVTHPVLKQPPILSAGILTPEAVSAWDAAAQQYFLHSKSVAVADRTSFVAAGFQDPLVLSWWTTNQATLSTLVWTDFLAELRTEFLDDNWDRTIRSQMLAMRMKPGGNFASFVRDFETKNTLLTGTALHFTPSSLRDELTARLSEQLQAHAYTDTVLAITSYSKWKKAMAQEDRLWTTKRDAEVVELSTLHARLAKLSVGVKPAPTGPRPSSAAATPTGELRTPIPTLTDSERALLKEHKGCYKCRRFYAGHMRSDCPDWPARPYKTLTAADAIAAQKAQKPAPTFGKKPATVAAVSTTTPDVDPDSDDDLSFQPVPIAAVYASFVGALGTDTDDTWDSDSDEFD